MMMGNTPFNGLMFGEPPTNKIHLIKLGNKNSKNIYQNLINKLLVAFATYASSAAEACTINVEEAGPACRDTGGPQMSSNNRGWAARNAVKMTAKCVINFSHVPNILLACFNLVFVVFLLGCGCAQPKYTHTQSKTLTLTQSSQLALLTHCICYQIWYTILGGVATSAATPTLAPHVIFFLSLLIFFVKYFSSTCGVCVIFANLVTKNSRFYLNWIWIICAVVGCCCCCLFFVQNLFSAAQRI